jgi:hypothetical protein
MTNSVEDIALVKELIESRLSGQKIVSQEHCQDIVMTTIHEAIGVGLIAWEPPLPEIAITVKLQPEETRIGVAITIGKENVEDTLKGGCKGGDMTWKTL